MNRLLRYAALCVPHRQVVGCDDFNAVYAYEEICQVSADGATAKVALDVVALRRGSE